MNHLPYVLLYACKVITEGFGVQSYSLIGAKLFFN